MFRLAFVVLALSILSGCVTPIPLNEQVPSVEYVTKDKVLIAVVDERKRVKKGKPKDFVGLAHASFGIPVDWHVKQVLATEKEDKERNLSEFLAHRIVTGLNNKGWTSSALVLDKVPSEDEAKAILAKDQATKLFVLLLKEWYFSINLNWVSSFNFDTDSNVYIYKYKQGNVLEKNFAGRDVIEESAGDSPQNKVLGAYREQLLEILTDKEVQSALTENN
ncbi:hypothetical protein H0A36_19385 [Endozoicomonas sp. SM1973]|uniref:Lipoprotein n=1 Tax=Spartinivicinus marinus TaxID=2994442 RepID=A0A853IGB3_9GAMM|nr:hypothetical protein [Spartinivicinus marinus]MCX4027570.1 hypothetical protein [Spartinivicinus marinus]NYZ68185.1 hypothetical protein [Spartinivicinus marinus]